MVIIKVLKRKDAASLVVGVVLAIIVAQLVIALTSDFAQILSGVDESEHFSTVSDSWQASYLLPAVSIVLQLITLELLIRLYNVVKTALTK
jgi:hypothetical protein